MPVDPLSRAFSALADPTRRDIVARLAAADATVGELAEPYDVSLPLTHWDDNYFYMTLTFMAGDRVAATGTSKGVIRSRDGSS